MAQSLLYILHTLVKPKFCLWSSHRQILCLLSSLRMSPVWSTEVKTMSLLLASLLNMSPDGVLLF